MQGLSQAGVGDEGGDDVSSETRLRFNSMLVFFSVISGVFTVFLRQGAINLCS